MTAASRRADLVALRAKRVASLAIAEATYDDLLAKGIEDFSLNTGEGTQSAKRRSLAELKKTIDSLQADINQIDARLNGCGIVGLTVARWP